MVIYFAGDNNLRVKMFGDNTNIFSDKFIYRLECHIIIIFVKNKCLLTFKILLKLISYVHLNLN